MSGTAGAAREAAILGVPAFAFLTITRGFNDYLPVSRVCSMLPEQYHSREL